MLHSDFKAGDLLWFYGTSWQSRVIEWATRGPSHVGIIIQQDRRGLLLAESTTLCPLPCQVLLRVTQGVQFHDPIERVAAYEGRVFHSRILAPLGECRSRELAVAALSFAGKPYDLAGALESGTRVFKWTSLMPCPDLDHIFCSAFALHLLQRIGRANWTNPKRANPADLLRTVRRDATHGKPVPLNV